MKPFSVTLALLLVAPQFSAQTTYTVCDTTEICICNDGSDLFMTLQFVPCQIGQVVTVAFCSGVLPETCFASLFNGGSTGSPIMAIYSPGAELNGQRFTSTHPSGTLTLRVTASVTASSCMGGDYPPMVIWLTSGISAPPPPLPMACPGAGTTCISTRIMAHGEGHPLAFVHHDGALHCVNGSFTGTLELLDLSGRLLEQQQWRGESSKAVRANLTAGMHVAMLRSKEGDRAQLIQVE